MVLSWIPHQDNRKFNPKKIDGPEFDSPTKIIESLILRKTVVLSLIPHQDNKKFNPKKIDGPEFDSPPR